jgi:hypothetical protein
MKEVFHFVEFLLLFAFALTVLFVILLVVISKMPNDNPLKMLLSALSRRVGATAALMVVDPVATGLPVIGEVWDFATIAWLVYFWFTFLRRLPAMYAAWRGSPYASGEAAAPPGHGGRTGAIERQQR